MATEGSPNRRLVFARVGGRLCEAADAFGGRVAATTPIRPSRMGTSSRRRAPTADLSIREAIHYLAKPTFSMCKLNVGVIAEPCTFLFIR
jgi:hypothetical protein